jgi:hypothetical protein
LGVLSQQIDDLEAEIERVSVQAEQCYQIIRLSRAGVACGVALILLAATGLLPQPMLVFLIGLTLVLGGMIAWGSNRSTRHELTDRLDQLREKRDGLIDMLQMRAVRDPGSQRSRGWDPGDLRAIR